VYSLCADEDEEKIFPSMDTPYMGILFVDTEIYFIKLLNIFYVSSMFSDVQFFFLTVCSFDVDCDSSGKPHSNKKSHCCYYNDSRLALSFPCDFSNLYPACFFLLNYYPRELILLINNSTILIQVIKTRSLSE
jgi:hypothetical protein